ncbi:hypothetical protein V3C99_014832 [Haemonchus contortus]
MVPSAAHFDARHTHCGRGSVKLMCALYFSGHGPPNPRLTHPFTADLKRLRNFVTEIETERQTDRTTDRQSDKQTERQTKRFIVSRISHKKGDIGSAFPCLLLQNLALPTA